MLGAENEGLHRLPPAACPAPPKHPWGAEGCLDPRSRSGVLQEWG